MFVPSQKPAEIDLRPSYIKSPLLYEMMTKCSKCDWGDKFYWEGWHNGKYYGPILDENIPDNFTRLTTRKDYDNVEQFVEFICEGCRRWTLLRPSKLEKEYEALFGYSSTRTKESWQKVKKDLYSKYAPHIAKFFYDRLREYRYIGLTSYYWKRYFSKSEQENIWRIFAELTEGEYCIDNYRVARIGKKRQIKRYEEMKNKGCCGFIDIVRNGWMIGCNYGH